MRRNTFLLCSLLLLTAIGQYELLQMFEAGRRHGLLVVSVTVGVAIASNYLVLAKLKRVSLFHCIVSEFATTTAACLTLLIAEKVGQPEAVVILRSDGVVVVLLTTALAGGWLVGLVTILIFALQSRNIQK